MELLPDQREESVHDMVLVLNDVSKAYPGVQALQEVSLDVRAGEVHAIVGGNGAGKSTLIKVAAGVVRPDAGEVLVDGRRMTSSPADARLRGVAVLHQDRKITPDLTVAENVLLGRLPTSAGRVSWSTAYRTAQEALDRFGLALDARTPARALTPQQLQEIELVRALCMRARVVIMDEPSAALAGDGLERLYASVRQLRDSGVAVVYISHHLKEVFDVSDRITVLRDGRKVDTFSTAEQSHDGLVHAMFGDVAVPQRSSDSVDISDRTPALRATNVVRRPGLKGVSLEVRPGEILGIVGAVGSGRRELARCLAGVETPDEGSIVHNDDRGVSRSPRAALASGIAMVPEDRKRDGLLLDLSIADNIELSRRNIESSWFARPGKARTVAREYVERLNIKTPGVHTIVRTLSGGNQQKVLLARCLRAEVDLFVLDEPTAGIDVRSRMEIYELMRTLAGRGSSLVVFTSDYEELRLIADRALVLAGGRIRGELLRDELSDERIMALESDVVAG